MSDKQDGEVDHDNGVSIENIVCCNDHGNSGQIMERVRLGGYDCPECGRHADLRIKWKDGGDDAK